MTEARHDGTGDIAYTIMPRDAGDDAAQLIAGLTAPEAAIPPKYFYDPLGSRLFDAITELDEYYPTRTEAAIFRQHGADMGTKAGKGRTLIDLGAGNCEKAESLFGMLEPASYVAVDISTDFLRWAVTQLRIRCPHIAMHGVSADFASRLELPDSIPRERRLFFYPGSSIGNFTPLDAGNFLRQVAELSGPDGALLIGVDLVKDHHVLEDAYDDVLGVTAAFNLNVLNHVNRIVGSDFRVQDWQHRALFNADASRIEMHLAARRDVSVRWNGGSRSFRQGETIHTENSYKYTQSGLVELLKQAGFGRIETWTDAKGWFAVLLASRR
jgi:dimethylhistidine N-methyltransferase